tara:strand:+ start:873 stop:1505 length:633 start_codon:yes stop_codon:yes gene_type:complete
MYFKIILLSKTNLNFLYKLRNHSISKKYSISKEEITFEQHVKWFNNFLKSKNKKCFIVKTTNGESIGYVRFIITNKIAEVSIAIIEKYQNKGLSKKILLECEKKINLSEFKARVHVNNSKSISLFKSLDYNITKKTNKFYIMKKSLNKEKYPKYLKVINEIENVRKKNNSNWMGILKIAFKYSPNETAKIMKNIYREDKTISFLAKKLTK